MVYCLLFIFIHFHCLGLIHCLLIRVQGKMRPSRELGANLIRTRISEKYDLSTKVTTHVKLPVTSQSNCVVIFVANRTRNRISEKYSPRLNQDLIHFSGPLLRQSSVHDPSRRALVFGSCRACAGHSAEPPGAEGLTF